MATSRTSPANIFRHARYTSPAGAHGKAGATAGADAAIHRAELPGRCGRHRWSGRPRARSRAALPRPSRAPRAPHREPTARQPSRRGPERSRGCPATRRRWFRPPPRRRRGRCATTEARPRRRSPSPRERRCGRRRSSARSAGRSRESGGPPTAMPRCQTTYTSPPGPAATCAGACSCGAASPGRSFTRTGVAARPSGCTRGEVHVVPLLACRDPGDERRPRPAATATVGFPAPRRRA